MAEPKAESTAKPLAEPKTEPKGRAISQTTDVATVPDSNCDRV